MHSERHDVERDWELEQTQRELRELKLKDQVETNEHRIHKTFKEEEELRAAKRELDEIRRAKQRDDDERRMRQRLNFERLEEEQRVAAEKARRDKEAKDAVDRYKKDEAERILKEVSGPPFPRRSRSRFFCRAGRPDMLLTPRPVSRNKRPRCASASTSRSSMPS